MTTTINADTVVGGAIVTGDASGELALQAAGATKLTVNSSGVTLAAPLPVLSGGTGATSLSGITVGTATNATNATNATTATNLAGGSNGTIPYQSASGTTQMLAVGTSGQVLQTNGAGAPTWVTPGGGSMILLGFTNATNVTSVIFNLDSATYDNYVFDFYEMTAPAATGLVIFQMKAADGSFYSTYFLKLLNSTNYGPQKNGGGSLSFTTLNPTSYGETTKLPAGQLVILGASQASNEAIVLGSSMEKLGGENAINTMVGWHNNSGPYSQIKVFNNGGNISGKFALYGLKKS